MKKLVLIVGIVVSLAFASGCATGLKESNPQTTPPAYGYQFEAPMDHE